MVTGCTHKLQFMVINYTCIHTLQATVYVVYLVNNKFGELGRNAHWWTFQFGEQGNIECTLFIIHVIISSAGIH